MTARSSQLYESRLLHIGSPLFDFGILVVRVRHIIGLAIPKQWTEAAGVYRRRTTGPVFMTTTRDDKATYVVLVAAIVIGLATTLLGAGVVGKQHSYHDTVSVW